jgi:hypothetical protein
LLPHLQALPQHENEEAHEDVGTRSVRSVALGASRDGSLASIAAASVPP